MLVAVVFASLAAPAGVGAFLMYALLHPHCDPVSAGYSPRTFNLAYRDINIASHLGGVYRGYFIPGTNGATIIFPPPFASNQAGMLDQASIFAQHGYNVLLFESKVCANKGPVSLGYLEVDDVGDVLAYLKTNPDQLSVDMTKLGLHGFSSAGATSLMAAARYPEIRAVLAEGGYDNADEQMGVRQTQSFSERLILFGARLCYWLSIGSDPSNLDPRAAVSKIPPRPILFVYGSIEPSLPGAKRQLAAAKAANPRSFSDLWIVPGAWHGGYLNVVSREEFARHVIPFFECSLFDQCTL
jgi:hypothetical protein